MRPGGLELPTFWSNSQNSQGPPRFLKGQERGTPRRSREFARIRQQVRPSRTKPSPSLLGPQAYSPCDCRFAVFSETSSAETRVVLENAKIFPYGTEAQYVEILPQPPITLYVRGHLDLFSSRALAFTAAITSSPTSDRDQRSGICERLPRETPRATAE